MTEAWQARRLAQHKNRPNDNRSPWQVDRSRIIHAAAFRRLQAKTQIMSIGVNDFYRTRLTHSLEVAQIGSGLLRHLRRLHPDYRELVSTSLIETLCLAHDIGHPPFGHGGETALNFLMRNHGGFEGNAQTLRIVAKLEPYSNGYGMNLSRRTLLGFIKYPQYIDTLWHSQPNINPSKRFIEAHAWTPAKGVYRCDSDLFDWILAPLSPNDRDLLSSFQLFNEYKSKTQFKSVDCSIMELADDIAYAVHDLEDAVATGTLSRAQWEQFALPKLQDIQSDWVKANIATVTERLFSFDEATRKDLIGELVNLFIVNASLQVQHPEFESELLRYQVQLCDEYQALLDVFKVFVFEQLIREPKMQQIEFRGQNLLIDLFDAFASAPLRLLPKTTHDAWQQAPDDSAQYRILCDYLSGMSDEYAMRTHRRLFAGND
ncbi:anti-phage deoxyguanosine triphosphatase [Pseudoalteromonas fenneropenaei]|uniref:Deoxyguanosinetriphosphate triphosphohydrolase-like protein n=1 Tax=Pseudoalteromonas fenneropenaei TaxID=1737459 RepID=A0ABV7CF70_9GAMM